MREMQTRFGRENLGFFWLMGEPLFLTCAVMVLWASWHPPLAGGLSMIPFVLCGYTLITLWRHIVARSQHFSGVMPASCIIEMFTFSTL